MNNWGLGSLWKQKISTISVDSCESKKDDLQGLEEDEDGAGGGGNEEEESLTDLDGPGVPLLLAKFVLAAVWLAEKKYKKYLFELFSWFL